ncbi:hypothetical protein JCM3775_007372, partial [Rhodotorula graminis]
PKIYSLLGAVKNLGGVASADNGGWGERDERVAAWVLVRAACAPQRSMDEILRVWKAERRTDPKTLDIDDLARSRLDQCALGGTRTAPLAVADQDKSPGKKADELETDADSDGSSTSSDQPWSSDEDDALCGLYAAGSSPEIIADEMDRSRRSVSSRLVVLQREGRIAGTRTKTRVPKGHTTWSSQDDRQLLLWREERVPVRECAERLGRTDKAVKQHLTILYTRRRSLASNTSATTMPGTTPSTSSSVPPHLSGVARSSAPGTAAARRQSIESKSAVGQLGSSASPSAAGGVVPFSPDQAIKTAPLDHPQPPAHLAALAREPAPGAHVAALPPSLPLSLLPAYTDADDDLIVSYLQLGRDYDAMATALGRSKKSVARRVAKRRADWTRDGRLATSTPSNAAPAPPVVHPPQPVAATATPRLPSLSTSTLSAPHALAAPSTAAHAPRKRPAPVPDSSSPPFAEQRRPNSPLPPRKVVAPGLGDKAAPVERPPTRPSRRGPKYARVLEAMRRLREPLDEVVQEAADEG